MSDELSGATNNEQVISVPSEVVVEPIDITTFRDSPVKEWTDGTQKHTIYKAINPSGGESYFQVDEELPVVEVVESTVVTPPQSLETINEKLDTLTALVSRLLGE